MPLLDNGNDSALIMQFARGTEALQLAANLHEIAERAEQEQHDALDRFHADTHRINDRYLGQMLAVVREYERRLALLDVSSDDDPMQDDE